MRNRRLLGFASILTLFATCGAAAPAADTEACALSAPERHRVVEVKDGETLALTDGAVVRLIGARDALEVGTFTGYSAICIARGLTEGGRLTCLELDEEFAAIAQRNVEAAGVADRVEIRVGPAKPSLEAIAPEPAFDFAFIDADKPGYPDYYELVLERMKPGGLVLLDNMLQSGRVVEPDTENARVIDELNRRIHADDRVDMAMTIAADGLTFVRVR